MCSVLVPLGFIMVRRLRRVTIERVLTNVYLIQVQAIVDHHHADVKTASKVRFAEPGAEAAEADEAPSPPLTDPDDKDKDEKVIISTYYGK